MRRRSFLLGLGALVAAPAVICVAPLMRVKPIPPILSLAYIVRPSDLEVRFAEAVRLDILYSLMRDDGAEYGLARLLSVAA